MTIIDKANEIIKKSEELRELLRTSQERLNLIKENSTLNKEEIEMLEISYNQKIDALIFKIQNIDNPRIY